MKVLAILQNQWFHNAEGWRQRFESLTGTKRRRMIARCLFATRNHTGRRLHSVLGDLIEWIEWEESSKEIGDHPGFRPKPDPVHVCAVINEVGPDMIVCFGRVAQDAVQQAIALIEAEVPRRRLPDVIRAPHPAARQRGVKDELVKVADRLRQACGVVRR